MKTSWDKLMRYAPEREYPLAPLQLDEAARIVEQTMQKAGIKTKKTARPIRAAALAAAIAALLCVSALAAFRLGWFDRLFGGSAALVESKVTAYDETAQYDVTLQSYTEEEQAMIVEGTMQVPEQAEVAETGVSAKTDEFVFTLDSMLASKDTLYAVLRIEARTQQAEQELAVWRETSGFSSSGNGFVAEGRFSQAVLPCRPHASTASSHLLVFLYLRTNSCRVNMETVFPEKNFSPGGHCLL